MNATDLALWRYFRSSAFSNDTGQEIPVERMDYNGDGSILYEGIAPWGSLPSAPVWLITRVTYSNGSMILKEHSHNFQIWDNRTTTVTYG